MLCDYFMVVYMCYKGLLIAFLNWYFPVVFSFYVVMLFILKLLLHYVTFVSGEMFIVGVIYPYSDW